LFVGQGAQEFHLHVHDYNYYFFSHVFEPPLFII
jgi:hypothetical protein